MLNQLEENGYYETYFNNLYMLLKLTISIVSKTKSKFSTHRVYWRFNWNLPNSILMENLVVKEQCEVLVRTTKATILRANNDYSNIIAFTAFD